MRFRLAHARCRLIEQHAVGFRGDRHPDFKDALFCVGKGAGLDVRSLAQSERFKQVVDPLHQREGGLPARQHAEPLAAAPHGGARQVVTDRQGPEKVADLKAAPEPGTSKQVGCLPSHVDAIQVNFAGIWPELARDQGKQGGFASTIGSDQSDAFLGIDLKIGTPDDRCQTKGLVHPLQHQCAHCCTSRERSHNTMAAATSAPEQRRIALSSGGFRSCQPGSCVGSPSVNW